MQCGTQFLVPEGLGSLAPNTTYYLLLNHAQAEFATICWFEPSGTGAEPKGPWKAKFIRCPREIFETAAINRAIVAIERPPTTPPWLARFEGIDITRLDPRFSKRKISLQERLDSRYRLIAPLLRQREEVLQMPCPYDAICEYARSVEPRQSPARLALWFAAYLAFGNDLSSLMPRFHESGRWDRASHPASKRKLGRPSKRIGVSRGHSAIPLAKQITTSFLKRAEVGKTLTDIYQEAMVDDFGCRTRGDRRGKTSFYHPNCEPFPSLQQFRYWVRSQLGLGHIQRARYGDSRYRQRIAANSGSFKACCANLMERCELDAYYIAARPKALISAGAGPRLVVCRIVCSTSGMVVGIGFSYDDEQLDAYKAALFCAAVDKSYFMALFGLDHPDNDWPSKGVSPHLILDRGPGASERLVVAWVDVVAVRELAPSYSGQSKAISESSHPRETVIEGAPSHFQSDLNIIEMSRREIYRVISDNHSSDATARFTPEMIDAGLVGTPTSIYRFLDERGRNSAVSVALERAVRSLLTPVIFTLRVDGLHLEFLCFDSDMLRSSGLHDRVGKGQSVAVPGYVLPACIRTAWVDLDGTLVEVKAMLPIRDDHQQLYMSMRELQERAQKLRDLRAEQREHVPAARAEQAIKFKAATGKAWSAGERRGGPPPRKSREAPERFPRTRSPSKVKSG